MNGRLMPWKQATTHVSSHALHYGTGVFEGIRCYQTKQLPAIFRLEDHINRLFGSAAVYGIDIPYSPSEITEAIRQVVVRNRFDSCYIRPIAFYGEGTLSVLPRACPVEVSVLAWPWDTYLGAQGLCDGIRMAVSPWKKIHHSMLVTTAKGCGQYLNSMIAFREAVSRGYQEALLLTADGHVAEGSGENVFFLKNGTLVTNDESSSILMGITRETVLNLARQMEIPVETRSFTLDELLAADEMFLTGTAAEVTPVVAVEEHTIGNGQRGPVTLLLQNQYFSTVTGGNAENRNWLHFVHPEPVAHSIRFF